MKKNRLNKSVPLKGRRCAVCGCVFDAKAPNQKLCGDEKCKRAYWRAMKNAEYARNRRRPEGVRRNSRGQLIEQRNGARRIYWTGQMLSDLRRWFPTTRNEELAGCLGVSPRTVIRKARELGLEKDEDWLAGVWSGNCEQMYYHNRKHGWKGAFKKGNMSGRRFEKGHVEDEESKAKRVASLKRWNQLHPSAVRERCRKASETRKKNRP